MSVGNYEPEDFANQKTSKRQNRNHRHRQIFRAGFDDSRVRSPWNNFLASVITVVGVSYFRDAVDHNPNHWCRLEMFVAFLDVRNGGVSHTCDKQDGLHLRQDRNNVVTQQHGGHIKNDDARPEFAFDSLQQRRHGLRRHPLRGARFADLAWQNQKFAAPDTCFYHDACKAGFAYQHTQQTFIAVDAEILRDPRLLHVHINQQNGSFSQSGDAQSEIACGDGFATPGCRGRDSEELPGILIHFLENLGPHHIVIAALRTDRTVPYDPGGFEVSRIQLHGPHLRIDRAFRSRPTRRRILVCASSGEFNSLSDRIHARSPTSLLLSNQLFEKPDTGFRNHEIQRRHQQIGCDESDCDKNQRNTNEHRRPLPPAVQFGLGVDVGDRDHKPAIDNAKNVAAATNAFVGELQEQDQPPAGCKSKQQSHASYLRPVRPDRFLWRGRLFNDLELFGLLIFFEGFAQAGSCQFCRGGFEIFLNVFLLGLELVKRRQRIGTGLNRGRDDFLQRLDLALQSLHDRVAIGVKRALLSQIHFQLRQLYRRLIGRVGP